MTLTAITFANTAMRTCVVDWPVRYITNLLRLRILLRVDNSPSFQFLLEEDLEKKTTVMVN